MRTIYDDIYEHIELLRNGAIVSSDDPVVNLFRQRCSGVFAFHDGLAAQIARRRRD